MRVGVVIVVVQCWIDVSSRWWSSRLRIVGRSGANITIITVVVVGVSGKPMITRTLWTVPNESGRRRGTDADITSAVVPIINIRGLGLTQIWRSSIDRVVNRSDVLPLHDVCQSEMSAKVTLKFWNSFSKCGCLPEGKCGENFFKTNEKCLLGMEWQEMSVFHQSLMIRPPSSEEGWVMGFGG